MSKDLQDCIAKEITRSKRDPIWFSNLDLKYAYPQLPLNPVVRPENYRGESIGNLPVPKRYYGLTDMPAIFQQALDKTLPGLQKRTAS